MRRSQAHIAVTAAVAVLSFAVIAFGGPVLVTAGPGLALLAAPGYVWADVLLGRRVAGLERVAVATGLGIAVPVLGGVALYAAGLPLHRAAWAGLLAGVVLAGDAVLFVRARDARARVVPAQVARARVARARPARRIPLWHAAAFGGAILIAIGGVGLARAGAARQHYPGFTALWLSPQRQDPATAHLGVSNQQGAATRYRLVLRRGGHVSASWNLTLAEGQTWQRTIRLTGRLTGRDGTAADLYRRPDLARPYRQVRISPDRAGGS